MFHSVTSVVRQQIYWIWYSQLLGISWSLPLPKIRSWPWSRDILYLRSNASCVHIGRCSHSELGIRNGAILHPFTCSFCVVGYVFVDRIRIVSSFHSHEPRTVSRLCTILVFDSHHTLLPICPSWSCVSNQVPWLSRSSSGTLMTCQLRQDGLHVGIITLEPELVLCSSHHQCIFEDWLLFFYF